MLFVHFTPVKNLKHIKKMGLMPNKKGYIYLLPMLRYEKTLINIWSAKFWWPSGDVHCESRLAKVIVKLPPTEVVEKVLGCFVYVLKKVSAKDRKYFEEFSNKRYVTVKEVGIFIRKYYEAIQKMLDKKDKDKLFKELAKTDPKSYTEALSIGNWLFADWMVKYEKPIPPKWIKNIYVFHRSDLRVKQYKRHKEKKINDDEW